MEKLSTKQFIQKFKLNVEGFEFNRKEFLAELNNHFQGLIDDQVITSSVPGNNGFTYQKFKNCIDQTEDKFWSISNKKSGMPFTIELWNAFYAVYVVAAREKYFPEIQKEIMEKRIKHLSTMLLYTENGIDVTMGNLLHARYLYGKQSSMETVTFTDVKVINPAKFNFHLSENKTSVSITLTLDQVKKLMAGDELHWIQGTSVKVHHYLVMQ